MLHIIPFGKRCPRCKIVFPYPSLGFDRNRRQRDGWSPYCKQCKRATYTPTEATRQKAREHSKVAMAKRRVTTPDRLKAIKAKSYIANREKALEKRKLYVLANSEKCRALEHARRAKCAEAPGRHTSADIRNRYAAQKGRCWWCKEPVGKKYHVDHIFALSRGGSNGPENICIACPSCNLHKSAKSPLEFAGRLF